jgi:hypothetical protein
MLKDVLPAITALFAHAEPLREPVSFSWRLVRRKKRPFLLLPETARGAASSLELYSAQRPLAKLWCSLLPLLLKTPGADFLSRVSSQADAASEWMQFLARQSGQPADQMRTPAIKFGGVAEKSSRLVLLLCDPGGYPVRVVKVGLNPQGRATTEREADLLTRLPVDVIGCTGITGRFSNAALSAFATAYFPGKSLANDVGIENLFHDWLNAGPPEPVKNLASWRELESVASSQRQWPALREALANHEVRSTIYHGDFTPWNVRMTNLENICAFDWEHGHLKGIPAWDWFHFIVQTSILVKRHSPERVAAELEQLVRSPRFQKYAGDARISGIIEPLLLAYLLHQRLVIQPQEGARLTGRLFDLLWTHWKWQRPSTGQTEIIRRGDIQPTAGLQIRSAFTQLANLFWQPSLSPEMQPGFWASLARHWKAVLVSLLWTGGVVNVHLLTSRHLLFTPFYLLPPIYLALKTNRALASFIALIAAVAGPLAFYLEDPKYAAFHIICWNIVMRAIIFQLVVALLDRIRRQSVHHQTRPASSEPNAIQALAGNWAVILIAVVFFGLVMVLDLATSSRLVFFAFYIFPCVILTLALNWRWGTYAAVLAAATGSMIQSFDDPGGDLLFFIYWNALMRLVIYETVVILLERLRRQNILFVASKPD